MQGKVQGDTFIVIDSFALPVEGTETRVNAASEANEYMVSFLDSNRVSGWHGCICLVELLHSVHLHSLDSSACLDHSCRSLVCEILLHGRALWCRLC